MSEVISAVDLDTPLLREVVARLLKVKQPAAILLGGSNARGEARPDSDLDLLIIERENPLPRHRRGTDYQVALLGIDHDIDLLVYTPAEIEEWSNVPHAFVTTAIREGRVLYEDGGRLGARLAG